MATTKFIQSSTHAVVGETGGTSAILEPGGRVPINEEAASHKFLVKQIEAGDPVYSHLSIVEVDLEQEAAQQQELQEKLEEANQIAAEARQEQLREQQEQQNQRTGDASELESETPPVPQIASDAHIPPQDEEAVRLAKESGAGQRATTQDDVADDDKPSTSRRGKRS